MEQAKTCPKCYTPNRPQAKYCAQCGQPLGAARVISPPQGAATVYCPRCRASNRADARNCAQCGQPLLQVVMPPVQKKSSSVNIWLIVGGVILIAVCCLGVIVAGVAGVLLGDAYAAAMVQPVEVTLPPHPTSTRAPVRLSPTHTSTIPLTDTPTPTASPLPVLTDTPTPLPTRRPTDTATPLTGAPGPFAPKEGAYAPDFTLLDVITGEMVSLSQFYGQPVMINFWATWCTYCVQEMPAIQSAYEQHLAEGLVILAVNVGDTEHEARSFADDEGLTFNVLLDPYSDMNALYELEGYPTSIFVKPDGMIAYVQLGSMEGYELEEYLALILE